MKRKQHTMQEDVPGWVTSLSYWLDERFRVPGTNWRLGLDGILGLVPVIGDAISGLLSLFIVARAAAMGVRIRVLFRMLVYLALDLLLGTLPVLGDLFDIGYKANAKILSLLRRELQQREYRGTTFR